MKTLAPGFDLVNPVVLEGDCMSNILIKQRAEAQFRKLPELEDGKTSRTVMSDYEAGADIVTAKIAHLKGMRLARDAAARAAPAAVPVKKAAKKKKQKERAGVSLWDWRKSRHAGAGS
jgi:hypothetical protein